MPPPGGQDPGLLRSAGAGGERDAQWGGQGGQLPVLVPGRPALWARVHQGLAARYPAAEARALCDRNQRGAQRVRKETVGGITGIKCMPFIAHFIVVYAFTCQWLCFPIESGSHS